MSLGEVLHQRRAQESIQRAFLTDRVAHAYLFHGPDGVGKETLAVALGRLLLCPHPVDFRAKVEDAQAVGASPTREACGRCEDCGAVRAGSHPDLHLIYRQLNREHPEPEVRKRKALEIGVDVLRHFVIDRVGLTPIRGRAKVFVIREADRMTTQAQNALLKTLEEPPGSTLIILLVTSLTALLPTTLSRCQVVRFDPLPEAFIRDRLGRLRSSLSPEAQEWCARIGEGSIGRALQAADDDWFELSRRIAEPLDRIGSLRPELVAKTWTEASKSLAERFAERDPEITDTEASRRGLQTIFQLAATWCAHRLHQTDPHARRTPLTDAVRRLAEAEYQLDLNVNTQLCVETLVNDLGALGRSAVEPVGA